MVKRRTLIASIGTVGTVAIAGCSSITGGGPEYAAEQCFTAIENSDVETANEFSYQELSSYSHLESDLEGLDFRFISAEELSAAEAAETREFSSEEEVERVLQEIQEDTGADDAAIVLVTGEENGGTDEEPFSVVQVDGDWKVMF